MPFDATDEPYEIVQVGDVSGVALLPERAPALAKKTPHPTWPMSESECLRRLEEAQKLLRLPPAVCEVLVEVLAPDEFVELDAVQLPAEATTALPGTEQKIEILAARVRAGEQLWHPDDATWDDPEDAHTEQVGQVLRNGAIKRTKCKVAHRDGNSIVIPHDPEEAADTLARQFKGQDWRELLDALHERDGLTLYRPKQVAPPMQKPRKAPPKKNATTADKDKLPEAAADKEIPPVDLSNAVTSTTTPTTPAPVAVETTETPTTEPASDATDDAPHLTREQRRAMWTDRIARWKASKLPIAVFCREEGCAADSFHTWKRKLAAEKHAQRQQERERKATEQAEKSAQQTDQPAKQVRQAMQNPPAIVTPVEIVLPCGAVLRVQPGADVAFIGNLARTLGK